MITGNYRLLIILLVGLLGKMNAQVDDMFNDGVTSTNNQLKINFVGIAEGDLSVYYERTFNENYAFQFGVGYMLPWYFPIVNTEKLDESLDVSNRTSGISYSAEFTIIRELDWNDLFDLQYNVGMRQHHFFFDETDPSNLASQITHTSFYFSGGGRTHIGGPLSIDYTLGLGARISKAKTLPQDSGFNPLDELDAFESASFYFPLMIRLGYNF